MNWNRLKVAYAPYDKNYTAPGDRRRFAFFAKERGIKFELANPLNKYDIVYLTYGCDIGVWLDYKKNNPNVKIIFELIDSYLLEDISLRSALRGASKYLLGKERYFWINYKTALRQIVTVADAVVCSTLAQKVDMATLNPNIHTSLDYFSSDVIHRKRSLEFGHTFKLVWEGQSSTAANLLILNNVLESAPGNVELHIISDPIIRHPVKFLDRKTLALFEQLKCRHYVFDWELRSFSERIANADLAIIPIASEKSMMWHKPENKLLLMWEIGIPTLTSATPAYSNVMRAAGLEMFCSSPLEWSQKILRFMHSTHSERAQLVEKGNEYLSKHHSKEIILEKWDEIFYSLKLNRD